MRNLNLITITFYILIIKNQPKKMNKQNKTKLLLKFIKVFNLPVGRLNSKSCQFHAAHACFMLIILFLAL